MTRFAAMVAASIAAMASLISAGHAADIDGAGSTFVAPIMTRWAGSYTKSTGVKIAYDAIGSGAGIDKIKSGAVDFGTTDKPVSPQELQAAGLCQFPIVVGGVVPVVNLPGIAAGQMRFTGALLAQIYMGKVARWDAPEVRAINPGLKLPALPIAVIHRADSSGTTFNWANFLSHADRGWKEKIGTGLQISWPAGTGQQGNDGVANAVTQTPGAIGYVEYTVALQKTLTFGQVSNAHDLFLNPNPDTFQQAAQTVVWSYYKDFSVVIGDAAASAMAYPITATTFVLMQKTPKDPARSRAALAFLKWALEDGGDDAEALNYVALPPLLVKQVETYWSSALPTLSAAKN